MKHTVVIRPSRPEDTQRIDEITFQGYKKVQEAFENKDGKERSNSYICALKGSAMMRQSEALTLVAERHEISTREKIKGRVKNSLRSRLRSSNDLKKREASLARRNAANLDKGTNLERGRAGASHGSEKGASLSRGAPVSEVSTRQRLSSRIKTMIPAPTAKGGEEQPNPEQQYRRLSQAIIDTDFYLSGQLLATPSSETDTSEDEYWGSEDEEDDFQTVLPPSSKHVDGLLNEKVEGTVGSSIVGCLTVASCRSPWSLVSEPGQAELRMLAVTAQGQIATKLVKTALRCCEAEGRHRVHVLVASQARAAHLFYEGLSFYRTPAKDIPAKGLIAYSIDLAPPDILRAATIEEDIAAQSKSPGKHVRWGDVCSAERCPSDKFSTDRLSSASTRCTSGEYDLCGL